MELNLYLELGLLFDTYGELLTSKMRDVLKMYIFDNMSYQEIADVYNISKNAVLDSLKKSQKKLLNYESKIGMLKFKQSVKDIAFSSANVKEDLKTLLKEY